MPKPPTLTELLDAWNVMQVDDIDQGTRTKSSFDGWYAVTNDDGIIAYFASESDALRFRLAEINRALNG